MINLLAQTYNYNYDLTTGEKTGLAAFFGAYMLIVLAILVVSVVGMWKVFEKAGRPGWHAIIPIYNGWSLAEVAGKPGWWGIVGVAGVIPFLGIFASIAAFILYILIAIELAKAFGKDTAFAVLLILLPFVGFLILGFGDAKYTAPAGTSAGGPSEGTKA